jgi:hypothetical protein
MCKDSGLICFRQLLFPGEIGWLRESRESGAVQSATKGVWPSERQTPHPIGKS